MLCMYVYGCLCGVLRITSSRWDKRGDPEEEEEGHQRIKLTEGSVCKASIAWDYPCYLLTFNH